MNPVNSHGEERIELAAQRVSDMLALADVLGVKISPDEVRAAALVELPPDAEWFAAWTLNLAQANLKVAALVLAGQAPDAFFAAIRGPIPSAPNAPARRPRRPRLTAAERRAAADRRATEWLAGPAWEIVDGHEPEPSPDGGCM